MATVDITIEQGIITGVFEHLALKRYGQNVVVELVEGSGDVVALGTLAWDAQLDGWRIMALASLRGLDLLRTLLHELAHILHKDVGQVPTPEEELQGMRDRLAGRRTPAAAVIEAKSRKRYADGIEFYFEAAADAFAEAIAVDVWPNILDAIRQVESGG